jgi:hypothetical protein
MQPVRPGWSFEEAISRQLSAFSSSAEFLIGAALQADSGELKAES